MVTPINVHEVMGLLRRLSSRYEVRISPHDWRLQDKGVAVFARGETAAELRKALEERAVPTADEAMNALGCDGDPPLDSNNYWIVYRYLEHTKGKADA